MQLNRSCAKLLGYKVAVSLAMLKIYDPKITSKQYFDLQKVKKSLLFGFKYLMGYLMGGFQLEFVSLSRVD